MLSIKQGQGEGRVEERDPGLWERLGEGGGRWRKRPVVGLPGRPGEEIVHCI